MKVALLLTARCNAGCAHCSTNCGPTRTERLSPELLRSLMDQAAALSRGEPLAFYLSGGEPFLDLGLLLRIISHGKELGAVVTCVTNGSWGTSETRARSIATSVKAAGLAELAVSRSRFHDPFVPRQRVERVLRACAAVGLPCTVKYVHLRGHDKERRGIRSLARAAGASRVQELPLMPYLRTGERLPESAFPRRRGLPAGPCPARLLTIREDGQAFTCCTPGAFAPLLALGDARRESVEELADRFYLGGVQQILRQEGPIRFARAARARGLGGRLRAAYAGECDLCAHIASDPALAAVAAAEAESYEVRQLRDILGVRREPAPRGRNVPPNTRREKKHGRKEEEAQEVDP